MVEFAVRFIMRLVLSVKLLLALRVPPLSVILMVAAVGAVPKLPSDVTLKIPFETVVPPP